MNVKALNHYQSRLKKLRSEAESSLDANQADSAALKKINQQKINASDLLLCELQVHQVELEMQNKQLIQANLTEEILRNRYTDLYDFAPIAYFTINPDGITTELNLKASSMFGIDRNNPIQRRFARFIADQDKDRWHQIFMRLKKQATGSEISVCLILKRTDDSSFYGQLNCRRAKDEDSLGILHVTVADISEIKKAEADLRIAATAFESQEGIFITDPNTVILKINRSFTRITGYTEEDIVGKTPRILHSDVQDTSFYKHMWNSINTKGSWQGEIFNKRKNGDTYFELLSITAIYDKNNVLQNYVGSLIDISSQKAAAEQIEKLAFYDQLTGMPNRRLLLDRLKHALASSSRSGKNCALMFIDVDNFKSLNDTQGHDMGDLLLKKMAERLTNCVREGDTVSRIGGDEFVVMLENLSNNLELATNQTQTIAEKMLVVLSEHYLLASHEFRCTSSIGIILFSGHNASVDDLLKRVDIAMYQAKHSGRNRLCFFDKIMQSRLETRVKLEQDLRLGMSQNQFLPYYQKQVSHDGSTIGAELLIRWLHPQDGIIAPMQFIPLAEESGMILQMGQYMLEIACKQLEIWKNSPVNKSLSIAVNVSSRQFYQPDFVNTLVALINKYAINPNKLDLELTETVVLDNIDDAMTKMRALNQLGIKFSIDDFGTGYSSLAYLTQLPLSFLKIDQSFVRNIGVKAHDGVIIQTILAMAKSLGMTVIAEGVETEAQRDFLAINGCKLYQGFLFGKPVPLIEFEQSLLAN